MRRGRRTLLVPAGLVGVVVAGVLAGCAGGGSDPGASGGLPQGSDTVTIDPADFTVDITNKFWPMKPGDRYVYEEKDFDGTLTRDEVTVLMRTEKIAGVETRVVHDLATVDGQTVE